MYDRVSGLVEKYLFQLQKMARMDTGWIQEILINTGNINTGDIE